MPEVKRSQSAKWFVIWRRPLRSLGPSRSVLWIPAGTLLLIASIWLVTIARIQTEGRDARNAAANATAQVAASFAAHVDKTIHDADVVVRWVEYEYERSPSTFRVNALNASGVISADTALQVTIVGPNGEVLQTTTPDAHPVNLSDRPHFIAHKNNPKLDLYISRPVLGRVSHQWTLQFTRRLELPDRSFAGVVVVSEDPNFLTTGFNNLDAVGHESMLAVISDNGYLLSRRAAGEPASPEGPPASAYRGILGAIGQVSADPVDQVRRFVTYQHSTRYPVAVLVGMSENTALVSYRHAKALYLLLAGLLSAVLMIAGGLITATMVRLAAARANMQHLAETDALTGLPNRYLLTETLRKRIEEGEPSGRLALLFVDLDNFKRINDALGHQTGDELLQNVARRLARVAGSNSFLARVGGDEFVVVVESAGAGAAAQHLARSIIDAFEIAFGLRGNSYVIRVSIGISIYDEETEAEYDLLRRADLAMYAAKEEGKRTNVSRSQIYAPDLSTRVMREIERQQELQYAIENKEFFVEYQPIVSLRTGRTHGFEALVRWQHPEKGVTPPSDFIPFAENTGFIVPIGEQVIETACHQFKDWMGRGQDPLWLSVNVSATQLVHGDLIGVTRRCLAEHHIDPRRLQLEITETALLERSAVVERTLHELRKLGISVILDDFGTGFSSLSHLTSLTVDGVKIDRSFTHGIPQDRAAVAMLENVVALARDLGLSVVVEGVETEQQVEWLRRLGDIYVQGYFFGRPAAPTALRLGSAA
ncbi:bifunctional diguanylate cyclase/phosphodiesterase [Trinickia symbiotica]|uniref:bifunctional diguanylate cyclase/phosphodiesterase n=1 Tax=Trinickia symbiotica TaxID=863227 RepID=UPI00037ADDAD|nr:EAL domain-containing protein [Trinickia symbiotica]